MSSTLVRTLFVLALPAALSAQAPDSTRRDTRAAHRVSGANLTGARLDSLPIDDPASAFALIPGVFLRGGDVGVRPAAQLSIRGGAFGRSAAYVDGAPVRSQLFGVPLITPALNGIEGVDVITSLPGVALSDVQDGVISYVTPAGTDRLQVHASAHTDQPFGSVASVGYNRFAGDVSGPVPGLAGLTFFASGYVQGQSSEYLGAGAQDVPTFALGGLDTTVQVNTGSGTANVAIPKFVQVSGTCDAARNGADCQGLTRPLDWSTALAFQGKARWAYADGSSVSITGLANGVQTRQFPGTLLGDPALYSGGHQWSRLAVLNWHHRLSESLAFETVMSLGTTNLLSGPLDPASETATRDPSLGIELNSLTFSLFGNLPASMDAIIRNIRSNVGVRVPYLGRTDLANAQPYALNPYAMMGGQLITQGIVAPLSMGYERQLTGRWQAEWKPGPGQAVSVGADADGSNLTWYSVQSPISETGLDAWSASPRRFGLFARDVLTGSWGSAEVGVRYDHVNPGAALSEFPGFTFSDPAWDLNSANSDAAYQASVAKVFPKTQGQGFISPRVQVAFRVDPVTAVRVGLGRELVTPTAATIADNSNADLTFAPSGTHFGRDVSYGDATWIEGGVSRVFGLLTADASIYDESGIPSYQTSVFTFNDPDNPGRTLTANVLNSNATDYRLGVDLALRGQAAPGIRVSATYGVQVTGTGSPTTTNPLLVTALGISGITGTTLPDETQPSPGSTITQQQLTAGLDAEVPRDWASTGWKQALQNIAAVAQFRMISGLTYTPLLNAGVGVTAPDEANPGLAPAGPDHSARLPWTKVLDLRITKGIRANGLDWTIFADFRNLLNFQNIQGLYAETNLPTNTLLENNQTAGPEIQMQNEAAANGALSGTSITVGSCSLWQGQTGAVDCVMMSRAEARFGNGDGTFTQAEQRKAIDAWYQMVYGASRFYGPQRTVRVGLQLAF